MNEIRNAYERIVANTIISIGNQLGLPESRVESYARDGLNRYRQNQYDKKPYDLLLKIQQLMQKEKGVKVTKELMR